MPRKPNYGLNKHRKEQDRKAKKDAKTLARQQRRDERSQADGDSTQSPTTSEPSAPQLPPEEKL